MNPATLLRLKGDVEAFRAAHPKFTAFLHYAAEHSLKEGNVLEVSIKPPEGREVHANLRLTKDDVRMLEGLRELLHTEK